MKNLDVDLLKLVYSVNYYGAINDVVDPSGNTITTSKSVLLEGQRVLKYYSKQLDALRVELIDLLDGKPGPSIALEIKASEIGEWSSDRKISATAGIITRFLDYTSLNASFLNDIEFENVSRAKALCRALQSFISSNSLDFNQLVQVPNCSKARKPKSWYEKALKGYSVVGSDPEVESNRKNLAVSLSRLNEIESVANDLKDIDRRILVEGQTPELVERRAQTENDLFRKAEASGDKGAALSLARDILFKNNGYLSATGEKIGQITEEQEKAMICEGPNLIAAGAGSGKTKVLAGKVVYHIQEQGIPMDKVIAVAFNKKASLELGRRIIEYGGESMSPILGKPQFKTTHSFAKSLIHNPKYRQFSGTKLVAKDKDVEDIFSAAVYQVSLGNAQQMLADRLSTGQDVGLSAQGYFDHSKAQSVSIAQQAEEFVRIAVRKMIFMKLKSDKATDADQQNRLKRMALADQRVFNPIASWNWNDINAPVSVKPYAQWTAGDKASINRYIEGYSSKRAQGALEESGLPRSHRFANEEGDETTQREVYKNRMVPMADAPIGSWFNFGYKEFSHGDIKQVDDQVYGDIVAIIGKWQAACVHPDELFVSLYDRISVAIDNMVNAGEGDRVEVASQILTAEGLFKIIDPKELFPVLVYGAFQSIKGHLNYVTFDDSLIFASKLLIENPLILSAVQQKYSHILVDEAQDLNIAQHTLFGLIAGTVDPTTGRAFEDGREMKAKTFCFIGDDKQAIYGFRGARPDQFTDKSDLRGGYFNTQILSTNFRSGRTIVDSANKLIAHNTDQIPMVCNANPGRDEGSISYITGPMSPEKSKGKKLLQVTTVEEIEAVIASEGFNEDIYKVGVICRTNAELAEYALELIVRGIPYYSRTNLVRANIFNSLTLLACANSTNTVKCTDALLRLTKVLKGQAKLDFALDDTFRKRLELLIKQHRPSSPIDWFIQTGWSLIYQGQQSYRNERDCKPYADLLFKVRSYKPESPVDLIGHLVHSGIVEWNLEGSDTDNEDDAKGADQFVRMTSVVSTIFSKHDSVDEALAFCDKIIDVSKASTSDAMSKRMDVVYLGTAHSWKGLEADHIWVAMNAESFPNKRALEEDPSAIKEERRLAYVAITRGRDSVTILAGDDGGSRFIGEACVRPRRGAEEIVSDLNEQEMEDFFTEDGMKMATQLVLESFPEKVRRAMKGGW